MSIENRIKPSWFNRIFGPVFFLAGSGLALYWFVVRSYALITGISSEIVVFDKGSFYMLGVGLGLLGLGYGMAQEFWVGKVLTDMQATIAGALAVAGLVLIPTVPNIVHFSVATFLDAKGYSVCQAASRQWLVSRDIVYAREVIVCSKDLLIEHGLSSY